MNWAQGITLAFCCFGTIIFSMVGISMGEDVNLVAEDYYEQEIAYQDQIEKINNYNNLLKKPKITINEKAGKCYVSFSEGNLKSGTIHFFRPSDSKKDLIYKIQDQDIEVDVKELIKGYWTIKLDWEDGEKSYYHEKSFTKL